MSTAPILFMLLKSVFRKPATRMYPRVKRAPYAGTRARIEIRFDECVLCTICDKKCPTGAIAVDREKKSWEVERLRCIACNACVEACPKKCIDMSAERKAVSRGSSKERHERA